MDDKECSFYYGLLLGMAAMFCACALVGVATHTWDEDIVSCSGTGKLLKIDNNKYKIVCVERLDWINTEVTEDDVGYVEVEMNVSAYCSCEKCCGSFADGVTASGVPAGGFVVAAPPDYPFGTRMEIPGYAGGRPVEVKDRGGSIKGNRLDVLFPTHQEALEWGRQYLKVKVYK